MKSAEFNRVMAESLGLPLKTVTTYTRFLKEAGLLTTGARGVNAPDMTPMDAARTLIAVLASDGPSQAVERVRRFGPMPFDPNFDIVWPHYANIGQARYSATYEGETFEEALAFLFSRYQVLGIDGASSFFLRNVVSVRIEPFDILGELVQWGMEDGRPVREEVAPFKGDPYDSQFPKITGHIRTTRMVTGDIFSLVGIMLAASDEEASEG
ncbi:hypothetical protein [Citromicrobium bathyomarinum]|uniref:hypothetical protein n=1 Tax=Citromicrobium bathyomarinum TaxID=72174 RepID=UPI00315AE181